LGTIMTPAMSRLVLALQHEQKITFSTPAWLESQLYNQSDGTGFLEC